jgi:threonine dehydrogenase-like Zn-dependent dehydrogenase
MEGLEVYRSVPRYVAARAVSGRAPGLVTSGLAALRLVNKPRLAPAERGDGWVRVAPRLSGICGSDLALLTGSSPYYFSPLVSMPFVPGHEVVGDLSDDADGLGRGQRVVIDPVLSCSARGLPLCRSCASGNTNLCDNVIAGHISPGLQTGYCADTGGGWSGAFRAHVSQLYALPDEIPDVRAVMIEPLACAVRAALRSRASPGSTVLVSGAGALGILIVAALRRLLEPERIVAVAKHPRQKELAAAFGASDVVDPSHAFDAIRRWTRTFRLQPERGAPFLLGGVDVAVDAAGSTSSVDLALRTVRAGGRVVLAGLPAQRVDLAPAWFRELEVVGAYAGGAETLNRSKRPVFEIAIDLAKDLPLEDLVGGVYPLAAYKQAIDHALSAGRLGTARIVFSPLSSQGGPR